MEERIGVITMRGNPLTLVGKELKEGDTAPDFEVLDNGLSPVKLASFKGKVCVISSVPSLDTPVCDMETRRFNLEAGKLGADVQILTISMDLPFVGGVPMFSGEDSRRQTVKRSGGRRHET